MGLLSRPKTEHPTTEEQIMNRLIEKIILFSMPNPEELKDEKLVEERSLKVEREIRDAFHLTSDYYTSDRNRFLLKNALMGSSDIQECVKDRWDDISKTYKMYYYPDGKMDSEPWWEYWNRT